MFELKKQFRFEAAHVLVGHDGKCARLHGHSWIGEVILKGENLLESPPTKQGMLVDFGDVSAAVKPLVEDYLDHHYLNETLGTQRPTSEFVAKWVYDNLKHHLPLLHAVTIHETCTSECTYCKGVA